MISPNIRVGLAMVAAGSLFLGGMTVPVDMILGGMISTAGSFVVGVLAATAK